MANIVSLPLVQQLTNGTTADATQVMADLNQIATNVNANAIAANGSNALTANLPAGGFKLIGLGPGASPGDSVRWEQLSSQGAELSLSSAATTDIGAQNSTFLQITGATTITSFGTNYNGPRWLRFAAGLTITGSATIITQPANSVLNVSAGDVIVARPAAGGGWVVNPIPASNGVGQVFDWPSGAVFPTNGILCNGASGISSTVYSALFNVLVKSLAGITITIASPAVVSWPSHGLYVNAPVFFTTTGALPTGLTVGTVYYVIAAGFGGGSFQISATIGGAAINTSGTQSGVHTAVHAPYGCSNDLSTFSAPNITAGSAVVQSAANEGVFTAGQIPAHNHIININDPGHTHSISTLGVSGAGGSNAGSGSLALVSQVANASFTGITATSSNAGSGTSNLAAGMSMRKYIRFA